MHMKRVYIGYCPSHLSIHPSIHPSIPRSHTHTSPSPTFAPSRRTFEKKNQHQLSVCMYVCVEKKRSYRKVTCGWKKKKRAGQTPSLCHEKRERELMTRFRLARVEGLGVNYVTREEIRKGKTDSWNRCRAIVIWMVKRIVGSS